MEINYLKKVMKTIVKYIRFNKNKCSICFEKLSCLKFCTINVIVYINDKIVTVLVSFLNVKKSQYKEFKGFCVCFILNVSWHFLKRQFSS